MAALAPHRGHGVRLSTATRWAILAAVIDIHCHILPGLDDGPDSMEISIAMAEMAIADGITHVIGTPHAHSDHVFDPLKIKERRDELQQRFEGRLILATGCDFHLSYENLEDIRFDPNRYTLNQKNYRLSLLRSNTDHEWAATRRQGCQRFRRA